MRGAVRAGAALAAAVVLSGCWIATREETGSPVPVVSEEPAVPVDPEPEGALDAGTFGNGRYVAYLLHVDVDAGTVEFDPFAFVTGRAARRVYEAEHPGEGGPPNDYVIANLSADRWQARVDDEVSVTLVRLAEDSDAGSDPGAFAELPGYLDDLPGGTGPFWFTFRDGVVSEIEELYLP